MSCLIAYVAVFIARQIVTLTVKMLNLCIRVICQSLDYIFFLFEALLFIQLITIILLNILLRTY